MEIEKIDKNFVIQKCNGVEFEFYSPGTGKMKVNGLAWFHENGEFTRIPQSLRHNLNDGIQQLADHTSGACVRFRTNSRKIAIKARVSSDYTMNHMTRVGSAGFDVYANNDFVGIAASNDQTTVIDAVPTVDLGPDEKEFTINLPLYNGVDELYIGLEKGSSLSEPSPYEFEKPVLFYGSSITQGGCASRPGNSYTTMISRWLNIPVINFGFSGNAKGEPEMAKLIASMDISCFVYDYDHNAPNPEFLKKTHEPFFKLIRELRPELPVIMISRATECDTFPILKRKETIYQTYKNAVESGDKNVYFLDGKEIYANVDRDACTVDGCHPNDLGFYQMGKAICPYVEKALKNINLL